MAKRLTVEEKLSAIRQLRELQPSPQVTGDLRAALGDKSNLIVAAAAAIVGDQNHIDLSADLEAAFDRCLVDPLKNDKLCRAKIAIVQALDKLEHERTDIFLRAASHVQLEPVWGGSADTAAPLRAAAILALARINYHSLLPLLVDSLTDSEKEVRIAAAQALGHHGSEPASLLLRLKARMGDNEPDVISECLSGLLTCSPKENLPFVSQFLDSVDPSIREAAILALGRSRLPEAFDLLKKSLQQHPIGLNEEIFLAMAMLRLPVAAEFLLEVVATDGDTSASGALSALLIYRYDPALRDRIADAVRKNGSRALRAKFERDSRTAESGE
jgi:HEAT repeat protein